MKLCALSAFDGWEGGREKLMVGRGETARSPYKHPPKFGGYKRPLLCPVLSHFFTSAHDLGRDLMH